MTKHPRYNSEEKELAELPLPEATVEDLIKIIEDAPPQSSNVIDYNHVKGLEWSREWLRNLPVTTYFRRGHRVIALYYAQRRFPISVFFHQWNLAFSTQFPWPPMKDTTKEALFCLAVDQESRNCRVLTPAFIPRSETVAAFLKFWDPWPGQHVITLQQLGRLHKLFCRVHFQMKYCPRVIGKHDLTASRYRTLLEPQLPPKSPRYILKVNRSFEELKVLIQAAIPVDENKEKKDE